METGVGAENVAKIHAIAATHLPALGQLVAGLNEEAHVVVLLGVRRHVGAKALLVGGQHAVVEARRGLSVEAEVESHEAVVGKGYASILVVDGRTVERIAALPEEVFLPDDISDELKCLNETEKKVIYLRYWERYKLKEISELLEIKYGCAKSIHAAAKMKIKKEFTKGKYNEEFT